RLPLYAGSLGRATGRALHPGPVSRGGGACLARDAFATHPGGVRDRRWLLFSLLAPLRLLAHAVEPRHRYRDRTARDEAAVRAVSRRLYWCGLMQASGAASDGQACRPLCANVMWFPEVRALCTRQRLGG